jgi:DNA (cytosine-5)-methyltransferase 1
MYTLTKADVHGVAHPVPYDLFQITAPVNRQNRKPGDPCHTLARDNAAHAAVAFEPRYYTRDNKTGGAPSDVAVLKADAQKMGDSAPHVATTMAVRRLTPVECERLQGFPDGYTAIPLRGKPAAECPDGPRYRALGNSMAVPCMRWIGERIAQVDALDGR